MSYGGAGDKYNNSDLNLTRIPIKYLSLSPEVALVATFLHVLLHCLSPQASPQLFSLITLHYIIDESHKKDGEMCHFFCFKGEPTSMFLNKDVFQIFDQCGE